MMLKMLLVFISSLSPYCNAVSRGLLFELDLAPQLSYSLEPPHLTFTYQKISQQIH
jgi:hypothetical protein